MSSNAHYEERLSRAVIETLQFDWHLNNDSLSPFERFESWYKSDPNNSDSKNAALDSTFGLPLTYSKCSTSGRANITERVAVPSCAHVAEIVGRQGRRIRRLREMTKTYIRTPTRGEPPVFTVTGRSVDVSAAKREILEASARYDDEQRAKLDQSLSNTARRNKRCLDLQCQPTYAGQTRAEPADVTKVCSDRDVTDVRRSMAAHGVTEPHSLITHDVTHDICSLAEHDVTHDICSFVKHDFTRDIRSLAKHDVTHAVRDVTYDFRSFATHDVTSDIHSLATRDVREDQSVTITHVPVPYRSVGLIVGCRGETIKRIQHDTGTHIVSPDKLHIDPVFVISGRAEDVERARQRIHRCVLSDKRYNAVEEEWDKMRPFTAADGDWDKIARGLTKLIQSKNTGIK